jgi:hypothetical protein
MKTYHAHCIEHGDRFFFEFQTDETDPVEIMEVARQLASGWGAECISYEEVS